MRRNAEGVGDRRADTETSSLEALVPRMLARLLALSEAQCWRVLSLSKSPIGRVPEVTARTADRQLPGTMRLVRTTSMRAQSCRAAIIPFSASRRTRTNRSYS